MELKQERLKAAEMEEQDLVRWKGNGIWKFPQVSLHLFGSKEEEEGDWICWCCWTMTC